MQHVNRIVDTVWSVRGRALGTKAPVPPVVPQEVLKHLDAVPWFKEACVIGLPWCQASVAHLSTEASVSPPIRPITCRAVVTQVLVTRLYTLTFVEERPSAIVKTRVSVLLAYAASIAKMEIQPQMVTQDRDVTYPPLVGIPFQLANGEEGATLLTAAAIVYN